MRLFTSFHRYYVYMYRNILIPKTNTYFSLIQFNPIEQSKMPTTEKRQKSSSTMKYMNSDEVEEKSAKSI